MNLKRALKLEDPETMQRKTDEKRRRLSYLKGKHQEAYQPSNHRAPKPKRSTIELLRGAQKGARRISSTIQKQSKKMPSDKQMEGFIWGNNGQEKKG